MTGKHELQGDWDWLEDSDASETDKAEYRRIVEAEAANPDKPHIEEYESNGGGAAGCAFLAAIIVASAILVYAFTQLEGAW